MKKDESKTLGQDEETFCTICYTGGLGEEPAIQLECRHILHISCLLTRLQKCFPGPRITFFFCECPSCKRWVSAPGHPQITQEMDKTRKLFNIIKDKSLERMKFEGNLTLSHNSYILSNIPIRIGQRKAFTRPKRQILQQT